MVRLHNLLFGLVLGASVTVACDDDDDGGEEHGSAEDGTAEHGSAEETSTSGQCADLGSMCHDAGEMMGGMAQECHDVGHDGDEAACAAIYDECIALCTGATTGATTGVDSSGGSGSGTG